MKRLLLPSLLLAGIAMLLSACTTPTRTAYKTIAVTETTVDKAMTSWGNYVVMQRAKGVDVASQEVQVKTAYTAYRSVMNAATAAWATYQADKAAGMSEAQAKLDAAVAACSQLSTLINIWVKP